MAIRFGSFLCVSLLLILMVSIGIARPLDPPPRPLHAPMTAPDSDLISERADTLFLFAGSGPGSPGSPGTTAKGFDFDGFEGAPEPAGWFGVDRTAQPQEYWHVASTDICAGTGTDMGQALPFDYPNDPTNDHALWCGTFEDCNWVHDLGYGNGWLQYAVVELPASPLLIGMSVDFAYRAFFEGGSWDFFEVQLDVDGEWEVIHDNHVTGEAIFRDISLSVTADDYPPDALFGDLRFVFQSDGAWSDEDGLFITDIGAVWLDNIIIARDGSEVFAADFEDGMEPAGLTIEIPPGAGDNAALRSFLYQEDPCVVNNTNAWAFWKYGHYTPGYPSPVIPYGPPYVDNAIQSPVLEVDQYGNPIEIGPESQVVVRWSFYGDQPPGGLVFITETPPVAAVVEGEDCLRRFVQNDTTFWPEFNGRWYRWTANVKPELLESADGGTITGLALQFWVVDMCPIWCDSQGDGWPHTPAPYYDNIEVMVINASAINWDVRVEHRFQDNFPEDSGKVRIDGAYDVAPNNSPLILPGDSTVVVLNMDALGGIAETYNETAGELRPELKLWWRVISGPNEGTLGEGQADPDDLDGIWSPWTGTEVFDGETWCIMQADYAQIDDVVHAGKYVFDFNDEYFYPGDVIQFFYRGEAEDGTVSVRPKYAMDPDHDLRNYYYIRCLPTAGEDVLLVLDDEGLYEYWDLALRGWSGYYFDRYTTQAPAYSQNNGLAGRAVTGDLGGYEMIIWDSGNLPVHTLANGDDDEKSSDVALLDDWLRTTSHQVGLWVLGDALAKDLGNSEPFLGSVLGVNLINPSSYEDLTGIKVPRIYASHPNLEYLGEMPYFWADGGCPKYRDFSAVQPSGDLVETTHIWEETAGHNMVAGILNRDPDGDGSTLNEAGYPSRTLFNPFSYAALLDAGFGTIVGKIYIRVMVGHILQGFFDIAPDFWVPVTEEAPVFTQLSGAWPNPFNPSTTLRFSLAQPGPARLAIYTVSGREVIVLQDGQVPAGEHEATWNGRDTEGHQQASGIYFAAFRAGDVQEQSKLVLLK